MVVLYWWYMIELLYIYDDHDDEKIILNLELHSTTFADDMDEESFLGCGSLYHFSDSDIMVCFNRVMGIYDDTYYIRHLYFGFL